MYEYQLPYQGDYALSKTLVGQCFRWKEEEDRYWGVLGDACYRLRLQDQKLIIETDREKDPLFLRETFDLDVDFGSIKKALSEDKQISQIWHRAKGVRLLKQPIFETIISFMISANNNIPRIQQSIEKISSLWGEKRCFQKSAYYLFPKPEALAKATEEALRQCGLGYRAPDVLAMARSVAEGRFYLLELGQSSLDTAKEMLMAHRGIGTKVSDCILLFGLHKTEAFPMDTWIKKVLQNYLLPAPDAPLNEKIRDIQKRYGEKAGYVQQAMFYDIKWGGQV